MNDGGPDDPGVSTFRTLAMDVVQKEIRFVAPRRGPHVDLRRAAFN
jgi:hypothetical protein